MSAIPEAHYSHFNQEKNVNSELAQAALQVKSKQEAYDIRAKLLCKHYLTDLQNFIRMCKEKEGKLSNVVTKLELLCSIIEGKVKSKGGSPDWRVLIQIESKIIEWLKIYKNLQGNSNYNPTPVLSSNHEVGISTFTGHKRPQPNSNPNPQKKQRTESYDPQTGNIKHIIAETPIQRGVAPATKFYSKVPLNPLDSEDMTFVDSLNNE